MTRKQRNDGLYFCSQPVQKERVFASSVAADRESAILLVAKKWVNFTLLKFHFLTGQGISGNEVTKKVVRDAFQTWGELGIGLQFVETKKASEAEIRIGFVQGDGSWSYVGTDILAIRGAHRRTMNFGWDITNDPDTALHEVGHTLGLSHEHQNPNAGIVWDEEAVYRDLAAPPNEWKREKTFHNIIKKLDARNVDGSDWDPDSIMHYPFKAGLIESPERFQHGLEPAGGISPKDEAWVRAFYPSEENSGLAELKVLQSRSLAILPGKQANFVIKPSATRDYQIQTFGSSDTVMVLFEKTPDGPLYVAGDDDTGEELNAKITQRLLRGKEYILRIRLYWEDERGESAVMVW